MISLLRFVGILNAAVWCGSAIFLTIGLPAIFAPEMKKLLTTPGVGFAAEAMVARFFLLQYWCGGIALVHLLAEKFYCGRSAKRWHVAMVLALLLAALAGGLWAQPKMQRWHADKYYGKTTQIQIEAGQSFARWHAISETVNLLAIVGLALHLWQVSTPPEGPRFGGFSKIRG